jgi:hypothetical protein
MKKYILGILFVVMLCLTGCNSEPMTKEERDAYEASRTHEYQVVSVYQYIATQTNNFGAVTNQELKYCFTYIGDDGQLHQIDNFEHTEYGLKKVCIGSENKYVVKDGFDTYRWLYLTEETFNNMPYK